MTGASFGIENSGGIVLACICVVSGMGLDGVGCACPWPADHSGFCRVPGREKGGSRVALLRRVHTGSYDRLTADPAASETRAMTGQNEAAPADLQPSGPGALDAFRHTV